MINTRIISSVIVTVFVISLCGPAVTMAKSKDEILKIRAERIKLESAKRNALKECQQNSVQSPGKLKSKGPASRKAAMNRQSQKGPLPLDIQKCTAITTFKYQQQIKELVTDSKSYFAKSKSGRRDVVRKNQLAKRKVKLKKEKIIKANK